MGGRAVVSDGAQYLLIIQRLSQTPGNAVLQIHVFNVDSVAVAVSHIDSGKHHGMDIPLPGGHVIGVVQIFQSGCIAFSPLIQRDSCSQTDIYAGIKLHGLLIPALHHPLQSKPMRVKKGLQLPGSRLLGICQKTMKQGRIQGMGTVWKKFLLIGKRIPKEGQSLFIAGKQRLIAALSQSPGFSHGLSIVIPGQVQAGEEHTQDLRGGLGLSLFDFWQVGHCANSPAKPFLTPIAFQPLPSDHRSRK